MTHWIVRVVEPHDHDRWRELFAAYRDFYKLAPDDNVLDTVWGWLTDSSHEVRGVVAENPSDGTVAGIAHYRTFARPSTAGTGLFLDDLFTDPAARGQGAGGALIEGVVERVPGAWHDEAALDLGTGQRDCTPSLRQRRLGALGGLRPRPVDQVGAEVGFAAGRTGKPRETRQSLPVLARRARPCLSR